MKTKVCEQHGHNYFQLHGDNGMPITKLACSKCGEIVEVKQKSVSD